MLRIVLTVLSVGAALSADHAEYDYCSAGLCPDGVKHVACQHSGGWSSECPGNVAVVEMNEELQQYLLDLHNAKRNYLALGKQRNYKTARRMATTTWDAELAQLAALNVRQCTTKRDACRNTNTFRSAGQNSAMVTYKGSRTSQSLINSAFKVWWNEYKYANMAVMTKYPKTWKGGPITHFSCMVREYNWALGCAAVRFFKKGLAKFLFTCNYATTHMLGMPVYVSGPTASGCTTGTNGTYPGLCKNTEVYIL